LITWCLQECDHIITVCEALKDLIIPLGIPSSKITVIGHGIDTKQFYPIPKALSRKTLGMPGDRPILLSVGILEPRKGHHLLIEALHIVKSKEKIFPVLYIIGGGPYREDLAKLRNQLGLESNVILVGEIPHQELRQWYSAADLLCLASDSEGWPNVLLESMACGTPVVASAVFGIPEVVTDSKLGLIVPTRTSEAFAAIILKALKKLWDQEELVSHAKQHTWDQVAESVENVFRRVVASRGE
jgi:teichuronic acid biosynthesis glycosyltransferase TuaC